MISNIFFIAVIFTVVIDQLRFVDEFSSLIKRFLTNGMIVSPIEMKPFNCSTCMTFWTGLVYIICIGKLSFANVTILLLIAWSTPIINYFLTLIKEGIIYIFNLFYEQFNK